MHRRMRVAFEAQEQRLAALASDPGADPDDPTVTTPSTHPPSTLLHPPSPDTLPPLASDSTSSPAPPAYDDSLSKGEYHRKQHKKDTRRRKRAAKQDPDMNRPMKSGAANAPVGIIVARPDGGPDLHLPSVQPVPPSSSALALAANGDAGATVRPALREPIISCMSLDMDDQPYVSKSAFIGILTEPTKAELAARSRADFEAMGFQYHEWDGKCVPCDHFRVVLTDTCCHREDLVILDYTGTYVVAAFSSEPAWNHDQLNSQLQDEFKKANDRYHFPADPNRRGEEVRAIPAGASFGGGQQV